MPPRDSDLEKIRRPQSTSILFTIGVPYKNADEI